MSSFFSMKKIINTMSSSEIDYGNIKEIQNKLLIIYEDLFSACDKYGLRLFLQGGTLLGKIRHNGFIPWDDDMDLGLIRNDYDKLEEIYEKELKEKYLLYKPRSKYGSKTRFAQIYSREYKNIWIDIFPIDFAPEFTINRILKGLCCNSLIAIGGSIEFIKGCSEDHKLEIVKTTKGRVNYYFRKIIYMIFGHKNIQEWYDRIDLKASYYNNSKLCTSALGRWHYFGELQNVNTFFPLKRDYFCGNKAWILNDSDSYLIHNYGEDYLKIPEEKDRESHRR